MTVERLSVWLAAVACVALAWAGLDATPTAPDRVVVVALGVAAALPLAVVFLGWLSTLRGGASGWERT